MALKFDFSPFRAGTIIKLQEDALAAYYTILYSNVTEIGSLPQPTVRAIETSVSLELHRVPKQLYRWGIAPLFFQENFRIEGLWYKLTSARMTAPLHGGPHTIEEIELARAYWRDELEAK